MCRVSFNNNACGYDEEKSILLLNNKSSCEVRCAGKDYNSALKQVIS